MCPGASSTGGLSGGRTEQDRDHLGSHQRSDVHQVPALHLSSLAKRPVSGESKLSHSVIGSSASNGVVGMYALLVRIAMI